MIYYKERYVEIYNDDYRNILPRLDDRIIQTVCAIFPVGTIEDQIGVLNATRKPLIDRGVVFWRLPKTEGFSVAAQKEGWLLKMVIPQAVGGVVVLTKQEDHIWGEADLRLDASLETLVETLIGLSSEYYAYGAILDPYGGNHTVALVGKKLWRRTIIIDEHEECCKMLVERIKGG